MSQWTERRVRRLLTPAVIAAGVLLTACASPPPTPTPPQPGAFSTAAATPGERLLVWTAPGDAPGRAAAPGQIALIGRDGELTPLLDLESTPARVFPCGEAATSPDSRHFAFFAGAERGRLYLMRDDTAPLSLDEVDALSCLGEGAFAFSPDSTRAAYIAYAPGAAGQRFAAGTLKVLDTGSPAQPAAQFENVTGFDLTAGGVAFVSLFTDDAGRADEAAIGIWDGSAQREAAVLTADPGCEFSSAAIKTVADGRMALVVGQRCAAQAETTWHLYLVDPERASASLAGSGAQPGAFTAFARTNNLYVSPDGAMLYFTLPDGVTANTTAVAAAHLDNLTIALPIERQAVFPTYSGSANATPRRSPDGAWLALVVTSPNYDNQLTVLDLREPGRVPIQVNAGSRGDTISALTFAPGGDRLYFVGGGDEAAENALFALDLALGAETRVQRGRFDRVLAMAANGELALLDWRMTSTGSPSYTDLVVIDPQTGMPTTLFQGADVIDGRAQNRRFAYPLAWRRPAPA